MAPGKEGVGSLPTALVTVYNHTYKHAHAPGKEGVRSLPTALVTVIRGGLLVVVLAVR